MADYVLPAKFVFQRISEGNGYIIPSLFTVPANGSSNIHIRNPHPDKLLYLGGMLLQVEGNQRFYLHDDFNSVTDGDTITIQNALMNEENGGVDSGPFEAYQDSTFDDKTSYPLGFTSTDKKEVTNTEIIASVMEPDRQAIIEVQNQDSTDHTGYFGALILSSY